jgi:hypothetical protein
MRAGSGAWQVVERITNRSKVGGFERWRSRLAEEKALRCKALTVVRRLVMRALVVRCVDVVISLPSLSLLPPLSPLSPLRVA